MTDDATPREVGLSDQLGPLPLWRDDAGRSWWGADDLTGAHLLAWRDAAVAAERERCAKVCEDLSARTDDDTGATIALKWAAEKIRA